jgi:hypothetical protein
VGLGYQSRRTYELYTATWDSSTSSWSNPTSTGITGSCWNCTEDSTTITYDASQLSSPCSTIAKITDEHWIWINGSEISQAMLKSINMHISKQSVASQNTDLATVSGSPNIVKVYGYVHNANITLPENISYTSNIFTSSDITITGWDTNLTIPTTDNILGKPYNLDQKYKAFIVKVVFTYWIEMVNIDDPDSCGWDDPRYGIACTSYAEGWLGVYDPSTLIIAGGGGELIVQP